MRSCRGWSRRFATCRSEAVAGQGGDAGLDRLANVRAAVRSAVRRVRSAATRASVPPASPPNEAPPPGCIDWRPSRLLSAGLALIGLLAAFAVVASELPAPLSWPLAALAMGWGAALARRELRRPPRRLRLAGTRAWLDEAPIAQPRLHWRGPLARLEFRAADGRRGRLLWWPDCLDGHARRELRLAAAVAVSAPAPRSVAP